MFRFYRGLFFVILFGFPLSRVCAETPLSSDRFEQIINTYDIRSAEQLLQHLPRESLSHYVILHHSGSIQWASQNAPRVVIFDSQARYIFSFNGNPEYNGYNTFDAMEFNPKDSRYYPREITFTLDGSKRARYDREPGWRCTICHFNNTDNVVPRFDSYMGGIYPKAFGSLGDQMSPLEKSRFQEFVDGSGKTGRYQYLAPLAPPADGTWPEFKPNKILGSIMIRNWLEAIVKRTVLVARLKPFRYALLAAVECPRSSLRRAYDWDTNLENYIPAKVKKGFGTDLPSVMKMIAEDRKKAYETRVSNRHDVFSDLSEDEIKTLVPMVPEDLSASFLYLAMNLVKGSEFPSNYATQIEMSMRQSGGIDDSLGGMLNAGESFYKVLLNSITDRELYLAHLRAEKTKTALYSPFRLNAADQKAVCEELKSKSLKALSVR